MWDTGECIPGDDKHASRLLNVQIQRYQKLMGALIEKGKMTRGQGVIFNERVLEEISEFQRQSGHQSLRAKRGHEKKKLTANVVKDLMEEIERLKQQLAEPPTLPPHQPPVAPGGGTLGGCLGGTPEVPAGVSGKKPNEINEHEQTGQKSGTAESRSQKPEERKEEDKSRIVPSVPRTTAIIPGGLHELEHNLLEACNGALDNPANCSGLLNLSIPQMWIDQGADLEKDVLPALRAVGKRAHGKRINTWNYFTRAVAEAKAAREAGLPAVEPRKTKTPMGSDWAEIAKKAREQEGRR